MSSVDSICHWLSGMPWFGWVAIVAIISGSFAKLQLSRYAHLERMAMIEKGINPDSRGGKPSMPPEV